MTDPGLVAKDYFESWSKASKAGLTVRSSVASRPFSRTSAPEGKENGSSAAAKPTRHPTVDRQARIRPGRKKVALFIEGRNNLARGAPLVGSPFAQDPAHRFGFQRSMCFLASVFNGGSTLRPVPEDS